MLMVRIILFAAILMSSLSLKAQTPLSFGVMNGGQSAFRHFSQVADTNAAPKKWFVTKYASISTGFIAFNGGGGSFLSAPMGLQLNRQLTNNLYAFAGISVAPTFFNANSPFHQSGVNKTSGLMNFNNFSTYSAAQMGLMYINTERTFSISGSIGVSRSSYNGYSPFYAPVSSPVMKNSRQ